MVRTESLSICSYGSTKVNCDISGIVFEKVDTWSKHLSLLLMPCVMSTGTLVNKADASMSWYETSFCLDGMRRCFRRLLVFFYVGDVLAALYVTLSQLVGHWVWGFIFMDHRGAI